MLSMLSPGTPGTGTGWLDSGTPSISSRLEAASVLTSSTRRPASANAMAVAVDKGGFTHTTLAGEEQKRVGWASRPRARG